MIIGKTDRERQLRVLICVIRLANVAVQELAVLLYLYLVQCNRLRTHNLDGFAARRARQKKRTGKPSNRQLGAFCYCAPLSRCGGDRAN
jgi:hypothetical protein